MSRIVVTGSLHPLGMEILAPYGPRVLPNLSPETLSRFLADAQAVVLRTNLQFTDKVMHLAPKLEIISRTGVGVDNVDLKEACRRGIRVCNTPGANSSSVAEHTMALILGCARQLVSMDCSVCRGDWKARNRIETVNLRGKILGLLGLGRVGLETARIARTAFNMQIIAYDPYVSESEDSISMMGSLESLFSESDILSVHVPYVPETHHLVNAARLGLMKKEAYFINTSRGSVVDEQALCEALKNHLIAGAGIDVFENEPPEPSNPLLQLDCVIRSPHSAALTNECLRDVAALAARQAVDHLEGREPPHIVNRHQLSELNDNTSR